eukprot:scaffold176064_cov18-Tisochrysis_lutea.AAC.1
MPEALLLFISVSLLREDDTNAQTWCAPLLHGVHMFHTATAFGHALYCALAVKMYDPAQHSSQTIGEWLPQCRMVLPCLGWYELKACATDGLNANACSLLKASEAGMNPASYPWQSPGPL